MVTGTSPSSLQGFQWQWLWIESTTVSTGIDIIPALKDPDPCEQWMNFMATGPEQGLAPQPGDTYQLGK